MEGGGVTQGETGPSFIASQQPQVCWPWMALGWGRSPLENSAWASWDRWGPEPRKLVSVLENAAGCGWLEQLTRPSPATELLRQSFHFRNQAETRDQAGHTLGRERG